MKRPIYNQDQRWNIIHNTTIGAGLSIGLEFKKMLRELSIEKICLNLHKTVDMCFKKLFGNKPPEMPEEKPYTGKTALLFAANDFPGSSNDLKGCLNDQEQEMFWLNTYFPDFVIYNFQDKQYTANTAREWIKKYIAKLQPGDKLYIAISGHGTRGVDPYGEEIDGYIEGLYTSDGSVLWDYEFREILNKIPEGAEVTISLDTCFSGGSITRMKKGKNYLKPRFIETQPIKPGLKRKRTFTATAKNIRYIQFAACQENQTAADAYIVGKYRGAFTYFKFAAYDHLFTCSEWVYKIGSDIETYSQLTQIPDLLGNEEMMNKEIFS